MIRLQLLLLAVCELWHHHLTGITWNINTKHHLPHPLTLTGCKLYRGWLIVRLHLLLLVVCELWRHHLAGITWNLNTKHHLPHPLILTSWQGLVSRHTAFAVCLWSVTSSYGITWREPRHQTTSSHPSHSPAALQGLISGQTPYGIGVRDFGQHSPQPRSGLQLSLHLGWKIKIIAQLSYMHFLKGQHGRVMPQKYFLSNQSWKFKKSMEFVSISGWGTDRTYQND